METLKTPERPWRLLESLETLGTPRNHGTPADVGHMDGRFGERMFHHGNRRYIGPTGTVGLPVGRFGERRFHHGNQPYSGRQG